MSVLLSIHQISTGFWHNVKIKRVEPICPRLSSAHHEMGEKGPLAQIEAFFHCGSSSTSCCYLFLSFDYLLLSSGLGCEQKNHTSFCV